MLAPAILKVRACVKPSFADCSSIFKASQYSSRCCAFVGAATDTRQRPAKRVVVKIRFILHMSRQERWERGLHRGKSGECLTGFGRGRTQPRPSCDAAPLG